MVKVPKLPLKLRCQDLNCVYYATHELTQFGFYPSVAIQNLSE